MELLKTYRLPIATFILGLLIYFIWLGDEQEKSKYPAGTKHAEFLRSKDKINLKNSIDDFELQDIILTTENKFLIFESEAREYRKRAEYPHFSQPIPTVAEKTIDPIVEDTTIIPSKLNNPGIENGPYLHNYIEKSSYTPGEKVVLHAFLTDSTMKKVATDRIKVVLTDHGGKKGSFATTKYMTDAGGYHDTAKDLIYTAVFHSSKLKKHPANYMFIITYDVEETDRIQTTNGFTLGAVNLEMNGNFEEEIVTDEKGSHLLISVEVSVKEDGIFFAQASLYTENDEPIGLAKFREELDEGTEWIDFKFYGKHFCDIKKNGPYHLKHMILYNVADMPNARSPRFDDLYTTEEYSFKDFTCESFEDPNFIKKAEGIEKQMNNLKK